MGRRSARATAALAIAAAVALAGTVATASTNAVPASLVGCWHRHVPALPVGTPAGTWLMKLTSAGKLAAYTPGTTSCGAFPDFTAAVSVAGAKLTIGFVPICHTKGIYSWKASATALTLKATADKGCAARAALFSGVWKKK